MDNFLKTCLVGDLILETTLVVGFIGILIIKWVYYTKHYKK